MTQKKNEESFKIGDLIRWQGWPWSLGLIVEISPDGTWTRPLYRIRRLFDGLGQDSPLHRDAGWWCFQNIQKLGIDD